MLSTATAAAATPPNHQPPPSPPSPPLPPPQLQATKQTHWQICRAGQQTRQIGFSARQ